MAYEPHEIERLLPRHMQIMDLALAGNGPKEIAQALDMNPVAIGLIMRAPIFQHALGERRKTVVQAQVEVEVEHTQRARGVLEQASVRAAETQVAIMNSEEVKPSVRLDAADKILDRVLGKSSPEAAVPTIINQQTINMFALAVSESFSGRPMQVQEPGVAGA
jgi:hypothetical protein